MFMSLMRCGHILVLNAISVSSGTAGLKIAAAAGVRPGDEVITQGFNFIATIEVTMIAEQYQLLHLSMIFLI